MGRGGGLSPISAWKLLENSESKVSASVEEGRVAPVTNASAPDDSSASGMIFLWLDDVSSVSNVVEISTGASVTGLDVLDSSGGVVVVSGFSEVVDSTDMNVDDGSPSVQTEL